MIRLYIFVVITILVLQICESAVGSPHKRKGQNKLQDASIYPGNVRTQLKLDYSEVGDFSNLNELTKKKGFLSLGLFCVKRGAFILYRRQHYMTDLTDDVRLASGDDRCFKPDGIQSAQPIGPIHQPKTDSITFFSKPNFGSAARPTSDSVLDSFFTSLKSTVKSLIIIGTKSWTITTGRGRKFCLRPGIVDTEETSPICLLPDFSETKIGRPGINIVQVVKGCKGDEPINGTIDVTFCNYWGKGSEASRKGLALDGRANSKPAPRPQGRSLNLDADMCAMGGEGEVTSELKETLMLYKGVLTNSFDNPLILDWKEIEASKWKLELIDTIFGVVKKAIPEDLMTNSYINRIRELYVYQLTKAWQRIKKTGEDDESDNKTMNGTETKNGTDSDNGMGRLTEYDYRGMLFQTTDCLSKVDESFHQGNRAAWAAISDPNAVEDTVWKGLKRQEVNNLIIDMTWLITNMVGGICHKIFGYAHNYWALYIHLINNMYLQPVIPEWKTTIPNLDILLGGDINLQYNKLAMFTSLALYASNGMEPFQRPTLDNE